MTLSLTYIQMEPKLSDLTKKLAKLNYVICRDKLIKANLYLIIISMLTTI